MTLREFTCPVCQALELRVAEFRPVIDRPPIYKGEEVRLPVYCENGCGPMDQVLSGRGMDILPSSWVLDGETIGRGPGEVRVTSLRELRAIERESETRHRNGDGQIISFREFTQDRSNRHVNSFSGSSYEKNKSQLPERRRTLSNLPIDVRPVRG